MNSFSLFPFLSAAQPGRELKALMKEFVDAEANVDVKKISVCFSFSCGWCC